MKNKEKFRIPINTVKKSSISDNEEYSPITGSPFASENNFSFSPQRTREKKVGLAEALTSRPKNDAPKKEIKKTLTSLYDRAKDISMQKEKKNKAIFDIYHPFKPKLNPQSMKMMKIAKKEGKDLHHTKKSETLNPQPSPDEFLQQKPQISLEKFLERNYTHELAKYENRKLPQFVPSLDRLDEDCTFKPTLDNKSRKMTKLHQNNLYLLAIKQSEDKKALIEATEKKREMEIMKDCTFSPKIIKDNNARSKMNSRSNSESRGYSNRNSDGKAFT